MTEQPGTGYSDATNCAVCGIELTEPFGWCGNCRAAYCLACSRQHFCLPTCQAAGCLAGLCVRLVRNGELSEAWGVPDNLEVRPE